MTENLIKEMHNVYTSEIERQKESYEKHLADLTKKLTDCFEKEVEARIEERCGVTMKAECEPPTGTGHSRRIIVEYDPDMTEHFESCGENKVFVSDPEKPEEELVEDLEALLLAAAKRMKQISSIADERVYGHDLLDMTKDYMAGLVLKKIFGGIFHGRH